MEVLPKLDLALANLCFKSLIDFLEGGNGSLRLLFKNCAKPPSNNEPPVKQMIKI